MDLTIEQLPFTLTTHLTKKPGFTGFPRRPTCVSQWKPDWPPGIGRLFSVFFSVISTHFNHKNVGKLGFHWDESWEWLCIMGMMNCPQILLRLVKLTPVGTIITQGKETKNLCAMVKTWDSSIYRESKSHEYINLYENPIPLYQYWFIAIFMMGYVHPQQIG